MWNRTMKKMIGFGLLFLMSSLYVILGGCDNRSKRQKWLIGLFTKQLKR